MSTTDSIPRVRLVVADRPRHLLDQTAQIRLGGATYEGRRRHQGPLVKALTAAMRIVRGAL